MANFDSYLQEIAQEISADPEMRDSYYKDFIIVRDYVFHIMCLQDRRFAHILKDGQLFGSYANGIRIFWPDEFDVYMVLQFPFANQISEEDVHACPGFVYLDFQDVVSHMECATEQSYDYDSSDEDCMDMVMDWTMNEHSYFNQRMLKNWLNRLFRQALANYGNTVVGQGNRSYELSYMWRGIAYTITAKSSLKCFSIDFVPAIRYHEYEKFWYAVPKNAPGCTKKMSMYTCLIANPQWEQQLLAGGKTKVKVVLQLLQALCIEKGLSKLRCYFLVTACLWEIRNQPSDFWNRPLCVLFVHMLDVLCDYLRDGHLPFVWMPNLNLLQNFTDKELRHYSNVLNRTYNTLGSYMHQPALTFQRCASHFST